MNQQQPTTKAILRRLLPVMGGLWLLMPLTFIVPWLNSTSPPYFDLTGGLGVFAHFLALTGGGDWGPWIIIVLILVVVSRPWLSAKRRLIEFLAVGVTLLALQGGGAALNEFGLKEVVEEPRPHVKQLADATSPAGSILKMDADAFYDMAVAERRAHLCAISGYDELDPSSPHCRNEASEAPDTSASARRRRVTASTTAPSTTHRARRPCSAWPAPAPR